MAITNTITAISSNITTALWRQGELVEERERVLRVLVASYWVLMPILVILGLIINSAGLYLLRRPKMRAQQVTTYFVVLLSLDMVIFLVSVSTIVTLNGCLLQSHKVALYFAHFFFTVFYTMQSFGHYVIVWVCYDRFLAVWCFHRFQETQQPRVTWLRMVLTGLLCVSVHLWHLVDVDVVCERDSGVMEASRHTKGCEGGSWILQDTLRMTEKMVGWRYAVRVVRGLLLIVIPVLLVLVFNLGIVVGLVRRRLNNTAATTRTRGQAYSIIYITLAISFTSVATAMPTVVHAAFFAANIKNCHGPFGEEVFRATAHLLLLGEHLTHFLILAINQTFRIELKTLLRDTKSWLNNALTAPAQGCCPCISCWSDPSFWPCSTAHTEEVVLGARASVTKNPHSPSVPQIMVSAPEQQSGGGASVEEEAVIPSQVSLSFIVPDLEMDDRGKKRSREKSYMSEPEQSSARTSVMTLEDEQE